jgi:hypothetical protein
MRPLTRKTLCCEKSGSGPAELEGTKEFLSADMEG